MTVQCPRCQATSAKGKRFCAECGAPLDPAFSDMKQYLNLALREELRSILKSDYANQQYLEVTTTQAILERITSWAKIFASIVAAPVALILFVLGIAGFKTYSDFTSEVQTAQHDVEIKLLAAQTKAAKLQTDGTSLAAEYEQLKDGLTNSKAIASDVQILMSQYKELSDGLQQTVALSDKVKRLDSKVTGIADSIKSVLSMCNGTYSKVGGFPDLINPVNDAEAVGASFAKIGYRITTGINETDAEMIDTVDTFIRSIKPGDTAVFYYSGHGVQIDNTNYMLPIDVPSNLNVDKIGAQAVSLNDVMDKLHNSNARVIVVIIDACRNNPLQKNERGLPPRGLSPVDTPQGTFVIFSGSQVVTGGKRG